MSDRIAWTHAPTAGRGRDRLRRLNEQMEALSRAPLFRGLPRSHLRKIAKVSGIRRTREGEHLVKEGATGTVFFVILEGSGKLVQGSRLLKRVGPGEFIGEMAILTGAPRMASVIAETPMESLTLAGADLRAVLRSEPAIAMRMLTTVAERLAGVQRSPTD